MSATPSPLDPCPQCARPGESIDVDTAWCPRCTLLWRPRGAASPERRSSEPPAARRGFRGGFSVGGVRRRLGIALPPPAGVAAAIGARLGRALGEGGGLARGLGHVRAPRGSRILVAGPDAVRQAVRLAHAGYRAESIGRGDSGAPAIPHHDLPLERLHEAGGRFDVVLIDGALAGAGDPRRVLEAAARALAPDGEVVVIETRVEAPLDVAARRLATSGVRRGWSVAGLRALVRASRLDVRVSRRLPPDEILLRARRAS